MGVSIKSQNYKPKNESYWQNVRIYIFYFILLFLLIMVMKEYVYEFIIIKRGGLNHFTLKENIPDNY